MNDVVQQTKELPGSENKLTDAEKEIRWTITDCSSDLVILESTDGVTLQVGLRDFQNPGRRFKHAKEIKTKMMADGIAPSIYQTQEHVFNLLKSVVIIAIEEQRYEETLTNFNVHLKPSRSVEVLQNIGKNDLVLAPGTLHVSVLAAPAKGTPVLLSSRQLFIGSVIWNRQRYWVNILSMPSAEAVDGWKLNDKKKTGHFAPFWDVGITEKADDANLSLSVRLHDNIIPHDKMKAWIMGDLATDKVVKIPVMKAMKAIKVGERLSVHVPKISAKEYRGDEEPASKKQKK